MTKIKEIDLLKLVNHMSYERMIKIKELYNDNQKEALKIYFNPKDHKALKILFKLDNKNIKYLTSIKKIQMLVHLINNHFEILSDYIRYPYALINTTTKPKNFSTMKTMQDLLGEEINNLLKLINECVGVSFLGCYLNEIQTFNDNKIKKSIYHDV